LCGPCGFNSTIDTHLEVEGAMSNFLGTEGATLYYYGVNAIMAAFEKWGNLLIVDTGMN
jgi:hypothetical protein